MAQTKKSWPWALGTMDPLACCVIMVNHSSNPGLRWGSKSPLWPHCLKLHVLWSADCWSKTVTFRALLLFPTKWVTTDWAVRTVGWLGWFSLDTADFQNAMGRAGMTIINSMGGKKKTFQQANRPLTRKIFVLRVRWMGFRQNTSHETKCVFQDGL